MSADIPGIQSDLRAAKLDGWLFYDFRGRDPIAQRILDLPEGMPNAKVVLLRSREGNSEEVGAQD